MRFLIAFGVPEKSVFTRLFCVFATAMLANFQDRLVMTASICLRVEILNCEALSFCAWAYDSTKRWECQEKVERKSVKM